MKYYIVKSGMQMYDLSRAYGLGLILQKLSGSRVNVKDLGYYYLISVQTKYDLKKVKRLVSLLPDKNDKKWGYVFLTLKGRKSEKIKFCKKLIVNKKTIYSILDKYKNIKPTMFSDSKKRNYETLYQSLDLCATKGFREKVRGHTYHEGSQLYVPKEDFILSVVGHLNFTIWKWKVERGVGELIAILFDPSSDGIRIGISPDARDITKRIDDSLKTHIADVLPTLSFCAVSLAKEISQLAKRQILKFSHLIFGVMVGSGPQRKPYGGGVYPLEFLYKIINSTTIAGEVFDQWLNVFKISNRPGYESLALSLSKFITYPSEDTLEEYLKLHLRIFLNKKIKPNLYEFRVMKEVMKNV